MQIVDYCRCQKFPKLTAHWHPHLLRSSFREGVTRCSKCTYTVWIQPFPLLPKKLFNTRKAAHELLTAVLFAVTWIMGRQAWHMYPSCSVHWVMQAEMPHVYCVFLSSQVSPPFLYPHSPLPDVNRHHRGQEWPDLFCWWHHNQKGGPEWHHLHFPWFKWPNISSPSDVWQQHGHQSGDLYTSARQLLILPVCAHRACHSAAFCPHPSNPLCPPMTHHWYAVLYNCIYIYIMQCNSPLYMNDDLFQQLVFKWEQDMQGLTVCVINISQTLQWPG